MILQEFIDRHHVAYAEKADDWKDAIRKGCAILEKDGSVNEQYKEDIIQCVEEYGPYFILAPEIAAPHSQINYENVLKTGISLLILGEPVDFDGRPIRILFTLASREPNEHLENMAKLSDLLINTEVIDTLKEAKSLDDVMQLDPLLE